MSESVGIALRFALYLDLMLLFGLGLFGLYGLKASERLSGAVLNFKGWLAGTALLGMFLLLQARAASLAACAFCALDPSMYSTYETCLYETCNASSSS